MALVTVAQLQAHLRIPVGVSSPPTPDEADLALKLVAGEEIVLGYIRRASDADWEAIVDGWSTPASPVGSPATIVPAQVLAAILLQAAELWGFRGDDGDQPKRDEGDLSPTIKALLKRFRDPVVR